MALPESPPLTGPQSHYGEGMQNGLNLALEEANGKGIKLGSCQRHAARDPKVRAAYLGEANAA